MAASRATAELRRLREQIRDLAFACRSADCQLLLLLLLLLLFLQAAVESRQRSRERRTFVPPLGPQHDRDHLAAGAGRRGSALRVVPETQQTSKAGQDDDNSGEPEQIEER